MSDIVDGTVREFRYSRNAAFDKYSGITWPSQCFGLEGVDVDDVRDSVRGGGRHRVHLLRLGFSFSHLGRATNSSHCWGNGH